MKFSASQFSGNMINQWSPDQIMVNHQSYQQHMIIAPNYLNADWRVESFAQLDIANLTPFFELKPDIIILGSGEKQSFPPQSLFMAILKKGIGLEVMSSAAACRTYNVLASEGRHVIAGIMLG